MATPKRTNYQLELVGLLLEVQEGRLKLQIPNEGVRNALNYHAPITRPTYKNQYNNCRDEDHFTVLIRRTKKAELYNQALGFIGREICLLVTLNRYCYRKNGHFVNGIYLFLKEIR